MGRERHPAGLYVLFFTEMWERFSFYLMLGILPLYLSDSQKGGMGWTDEEAAVVVGSYIAMVYFTPFIGGLLADRLLGCRKTILIGGVLMMIGHLVLAWPTVTGLYLGLGFLILGNGAFKPNISTLLGNLYPPGSTLKDAGYNIFYMGINIGAFICNFVAAIVRNYVDEHPIHLGPDWTINGWHAAFATAALGMLVGLITFAVNYRRFAHVDPNPGDSAEPRESLTPLWLQCLLPAAVMAALGWVLTDPSFIGTMYKPPFKPPTAAFLGACIPVIIFYLNIWRKVPDAGDRGRVAALLVIFAVVIVFWMTFHLNSTALNVWTRDDTNRETNAAVRVITEHFDEFAENAPPDYFKNAGPDVARPDRNTFEVVSPERYKELEKAHELRVADGQKVYVTQKMFDAIYANATPATPILEPGKHLKLVNTELFQSINAAYVILFTPLVVGFWHFLRGRGMEPSTPAKLGLGLLLTGGGPLFMLGATIVSNDGSVKAGASWLFATYAMVTFGELCLSPMGLSLVNKMAPAHIRAFMMGGWFLSTSFGNKLSGIFGEVYTKWNHVTFWIVLIACEVLFAGIIFALLPWLNRQMATKKEEAEAI
ncbi:MAG: peptide MFS transporter [Gemmataceae bacterium]|nr:peptide MFS transporter [Gemmataceae bacterium]